MLATALIPEHRLLRARLRGAKRDHLHALRALERALGPTRWQPSALPPNAILFVRRLSLAQAANRQLAQALSDTLNTIACRARRPWLEVDCSADSVWFDDDSELVACLVRDWLEGVALDRWWWRNLLGSASPHAWLQRHVLARGDVLLPAAATMLEFGSAQAAGASMLETWLERLDESDTRLALRSLAWVHGLNLTLPELAPAIPLSRPPFIYVRQSPALTRAQAEALARLSRAAPELASSRLQGPKRQLLGLLLGLLRVPTWAHNTDVAIALLALAGVSSGEPRNERWAETTAGPFKDVNDQRGDVPVVPTAGIAMRQSRRDNTTSGLQPPPNRKRLAATGTPTSSVDLQSEPVNGVDGVAPRSLRSRQANASSPQQPTLHTHFGGLFYLLNAALALGLWGDFTAPRCTGLPISPWDWLARLGRTWFGMEFESDPLWRALAEWAGRRATQLPGHDFAAPNDWRIDPGWLTPWGSSGPVHRRTRRYRVQLLHPAGFAISDIARNPERPQRGSNLRWWRHMQNYLEARVALALGCDNPRNAPALLCRHEAQVRTSVIEVQVHLALADLPLAIRIAGLDRDPGWIPAAGRSLTFHFS